MMERWKKIHELIKFLVHYYEKLNSSKINEKINELKRDVEEIDVSDMPLALLQTFLSYTPIPRTIFANKKLFEEKIEQFKREMKETGITEDYESLIKALRERTMDRNLLKDNSELLGSDICEAMIVKELIELEEKILILKPIINKYAREMSTIAGSAYIYRKTEEIQLEINKLTNTFNAMKIMISEFFKAIIKELNMIIEKWLDGEVFDKTCSEYTNLCVYLASLPDKLAPLDGDVFETGIEPGTFIIVIKYYDPKLTKFVSDFGYLSELITYIPKFGEMIDSIENKSKRKLTFGDLIESFLITSSE